jgi:hypothetical protein
MLNEHPLFPGKTTDEVLNSIHEFWKNIDKYKEKAKQQPVYKEELWALVLQLLQPTPHKRIGTDKAKNILTGKFPVPFIQKIEPSTASSDNETITIYGEDLNETYFVKVGNNISHHTIFSDRAMIVQVPESLPPGSYSVLAYRKVPSNNAYSHVLNVMQPPKYTVVNKNNNSYLLDYFKH